LWLAVLIPLLAAGTAYAQKNVLQPSDAIIASSANSPGSEGVKNAIDGTQAKYLNFDSKTGGKPSGFVVTPGVGATWVTGIAIQSANDAPERDPKKITLEGSNDDTIADFSSGTWEMVYQNDAVPPFTARFQTQTLTFQNFKPYKHYRWTVVEVQTENTCCMQVAEVQLLGTTVPKNILQPADGIIASSANSPGSEGVKNAIDGTQAKYLNFDSKTGGKPSGFVVTPSVGATLINGISMQAANDAPERDPKKITLEGSNDETIADFNSGTWEMIYQNDAIPAFPARFSSQTFLFDNVKPYKHYRWTVVEVQTENTCCMQIAEVSFLGSGAPKNVLQPSDSIIASSANSPGSEGVKNAIDGTQAKYLNFDSKTGGKPSGFVVTPSVGAIAVTGISIQSANDAPERDPKRITVEGSNDDTIADFNSGTWEMVYQNDAIPAFAGRFTTQTFYFPNKKAFKHYRWTVLEVQTENTCCMQVAEVGLLAVTAQNDCSKAAFTLQPEETPVLSGSQATFFADVNGPWTLQWAADGVAIPGATAKTYTTPAVTAANKDIIYTVAIVGCQTSAPVKAVLFTPSSTKSIGIQFSGGGANGAGPQGLPNSVMTPELIAGVLPQAYFNVITNNAGNTGSTGDQTTMADVLVASDGNPTDITFEYATSGNWGAGVTTDSPTPTQRMLNGIAGAGSAQAEPMTMTFHNVPAGTHSLLVYAISPPLQFQTVSYKISTPNLPTTYYVDVMNSDQYKPAPGFYRATSTSQAAPTLANFIRFDNITLAAAGDVTMSFNVVRGSGQSTGVNALQLLLNSPAAGAPPAITQQPEPAVAPAGGTVKLSVAATGDGLTYQWRKNGYNLQDGGHYSGARSATLTISSLAAADEGVYSVAVFNAAGSTVSKNARASISKYDIKDALAGYWKLDESSGISAANSLAGGKPIILDTTVAQPSWLAGKVANSLAFDGASTFGIVSNYTRATKAISASAWVLLGQGASSAMTIARNGEGDLRAPGDNNPVPTGNFDFRLNVDEAGALFLNTRIQAGPNFPEVTAPAAFPIAKWTHVAFSADGAQLRLYINGQQVAMADYLDDLKVSDVPFLSVGARMNTNELAEIILDGAPNFLFGQLDELAVWNRALPVSEIQAIYQAGAAGKALDTVTLTPPATTPPVMTFERTATGMTITYEGTLQGADDVSGPYSAVPGAASPYAVTPGGGQKYFRATR
jgi:hypothetical protein